MVWSDRDAAPTHDHRRALHDFGGHYLATQAGYAVLEAGGNAVDAGVAAGMALGVVHCDQVQVSGVAPMVLYLADRDEVVTIAGLGGWPKATRRT